MMIGFVRMPANRAASTFEPVANSLLPRGVHSSTYQMTKAIANMYQNGRGTPSQSPWPAAKNLAGKTPTICLFSDR